METLSFNLRVVYLLLLVTASLAVEARDLSNWDVSGSAKACHLTYYQNDHPIDYSKERSLSFRLTFSFAASSVTKERRIVGPLGKHIIGPLPARETYLVVLTINPLMNPRIVDFIFSVDGADIRPSQKASFDDKQYFYFEPTNASRLREALAKNGSFDISYTFEDGTSNDGNRIQSEKMVTDSSFGVTEAMYKACIDYLLDVGTSVD